MSEGTTQREAREADDAEEPKAGALGGHSGAVPGVAASVTPSLAGASGYPMTTNREAREADDAAERESAAEDARRRVAGERAEAARVKAHGDAIAAMVTLPLDARTDWPPANYAAAVTRCRDMLYARNWQEFAPRALAIATDTMQKLSEAWTAAMNREAAARIKAALRSAEGNMIIRNLSVLSYAQNFTLWHYGAADGETLSTVMEPGFFNDAGGMLNICDMIAVSAAEGGRMLFVVRAGDEVVVQGLVA